jgi:general secretion pathway protein I
MKQQQEKQKGFTLVEVLIALVIIAVAFMGVIVALGNGVRFTSKIHDGMAAYWIAENQAAGLRMNLISPQTADDKNLNRLEMANEYWLVSIKAKPSKGVLHQAEIKVYKSGVNDKPQGRPFAVLSCSYLRDIKGEAGFASGDSSDSSDNTDNADDSNSDSSGNNDTDNADSSDSSDNTDNADGNNSDSSDSNDADNDNDDN